MYRRLFFFLFISSFSFGQEDKNLLLANFYYVEYYPDSTIKKVCEIKNLAFNGTTILFDTIGNPITIGTYTNGKESGSWIHSDGSTTFYHERAILNKDSFNFLPGCGTGIYLANKHFRERYFELIKKEF